MCCVKLEKKSNMNKSPIVKFIKIRPVKTPSRGTPKSVGVDFYIPDDFKATQLQPNEDILIPSGIKVCIPEGFCLVAKNKSGVATKLKLDIAACVIDEDYQGEIHLHVYNFSKKITQLSAGMKLAQFLLLPAYYCDWQETENASSLYSGMLSFRGEGGFGSTGAK